MFQTQIFDDGLRADLLLDLNRYGGDCEVCEVFAVLLLLPLPDPLRIERWIARISPSVGSLLFLGYKVRQLSRGNVGPFVLLVDYGVNGSGCGGIL